ncbi:hypothetical protein U3516DRAFT_664330 [Neocallimastix sp. 'constans']
MENKKKKLSNAELNALLKSVESNINIISFNHSRLKTPSRAEYYKRQQHFYQIVMTTREIVSKKLYKATHSSLAAYFKEKWKMSRSNVYRLLDAASVLEYLEDFELKPTHERICRTLKHPSKTREQIRDLWSEVLKQADKDLSLINSVFIFRVWNEMMERNSEKYNENGSNGESKQNSNNNDHSYQNSNSNTNTNTNSNSNSYYNQNNQNNYSPQNMDFQKINITQNIQNNYQISPPQQQNNYDF